MMAACLKYPLHFCLYVSLIKEKTGLFKSIIIPILAGFIGLILGPEVTRIVNFDTMIYAPMVTHFMGIGFIALTLANTSQKQGKDSVNSGLFIVAVYCFQGIIGMLTVWGSCSRSYQNLCPASVSCYL
jgi:glutamate:Na+ symporter, ESS family